MSSYITNPHIQFLDENGKPLAYGTVETYKAGTSIGYATMKDFNGTMNPQKIILDDDGSCCIILPNDQLIKMIIRTNEGRLYKTYDNVGAGNGGSGSGGGDYYGSDFINIDQIARVISLKNYKYITTDNTLQMDEDAYKITLKVNPQIIDVNKTIKEGVGIKVTEGANDITISATGEQIQINSDTLDVDVDVDEETGLRKFQIEADDYYTKSECDTKYQVKGNYANVGDSYTKSESDEKYQPKGNYALKSELPDVSDMLTKTEASTTYQTKGDFATNERVTNAVDALNEADSDLKDFIDDLQTQVNDKQDELVSGTNIKTINNQSLLGSGNIEIQSGSTISITNVKTSKRINFPGGSLATQFFDTGYSVPSGKTYIGSVIVHNIASVGLPSMGLGIKVGSDNIYFSDSIMRNTNYATSVILPINYKNVSSSDSNVYVEFNGTFEADESLRFSFTGILIG